MIILKDLIVNYKICIMSVKAKYQPVLDLGLKLNIKDGDVSEENGVLKIKGQAATPYEKNILWDKIKEIGGQSPSDIKANITVADESVYARHTVKSGESLSKIAKHYYGDPMKYKQIFEANTDKLKNPDLIHPDQVLVIPNL
jgi:nucleoid-associated protein YgaU